MQRTVATLCETCEKIIIFLLEFDKTDATSHQLLEILIYKATSLRQSGFYNESLKFLDVNFYSIHDSLTYILTFAEKSHEQKHNIRSK